MQVTGKFARQSTKQRSLFHPFLVPFSAPSLLFSPSLVSSFLFFSHTLRPGGWRGFGCTCGVAESLLKESMCFERSLESQASLCLSMSYSLPRSLSPRLCLPARRLPAPFDLMLCRTQHGLDNDPSLKAYIWVIKIIPLFPVLLVFLRTDRSCSVFTLLPERLASLYLLTSFFSVHYIESQLCGK